VLELRQEALLLTPPPSPPAPGIDHSSSQCQWREGARGHETTVVVYNNEDWTGEFRQFVQLSWRMQQEALCGAQAAPGGVSPQLQLVVFHPQATHHTYGCPCHR
jgi:hypothetical protein